MIRRLILVLAMAGAIAAPPVIHDLTLHDMEPQAGCVIHDMRPPC